MVEIKLLGTPRVVRDGKEMPVPRGRKTWALLAYLLRSDLTPTREQVASVLFSDAEDPLGALRWSLTDARRLVGDALVAEGRQIHLALAPPSVVDVAVLERGTWVEACKLPDLERDLLDGMTFPSAPAIDVWLLNERRYLRALAEGVLREAALAHLASGRPEMAIDLAARLVASEPLDEDNQALLIRSYAAVGDADAAALQLAACVQLFRRELGADPGPTVTAAVQLRAGSVASVPPGGLTAVRAQLEAGNAALRAGAIDAAIGCLQRAAGEAEALGNLELKAEALLSLGSALVHSGRNRWKEGASVLHQVLALARPLGTRKIESSALRELAWVELMAARYGRVQALLDEAGEAAGQDASEQAGIAFLRGMALTEVGRYEESLSNLARSVHLAESARDHRRVGLALAMTGKAHLMRRDLLDARRALERAVGVFRSNSWTWLLPWAEAYIGDLELLDGDAERARDVLTHAAALAREIGDPCFMTKTEVGLALVEARQGHLHEALERLVRARLILVQTPDHTWTLGTVIDALCTVGIEIGDSRAAAWAADLEAMAGRAGMRELLVRAYLHRTRLGDKSALPAARTIALEVDNPHLQSELEAASGDARADAHAPTI